MDWFAFVYVYAYVCLLFSCVSDLVKLRRQVKVSLYLLVIVFHLQYLKYCIKLIIKRGHKSVHDYSSQSMISISDNCIYWSFDAVIKLAFTLSCSTC